MLFGVFLLHDREVMHIQVAGEAPGEALMDLLLVRSPVALGALRNQPVLRMMTGCTVYFSVLARRALPFGVNAAVARTTGDSRRISSIGDHERFVNLVAFGTGCQFLSRMVRLVTGKAGWFEAMRRVARLAGESRMFARERGKLLFGGSMALAACIQETRVHRHFPGGMGVRVAVGTVADLLAVRFGVAGRALRHDSIPATLFGIIRVEGGMTLLAVETVLCPVILEVFEHPGMTLAALCDGQWLRFRSINLGCRRDSDGRYLLPLGPKCERRQSQCRNLYPDNEQRVFWS